MKIKRMIELVAPDRPISFGSKSQIEKITGDIVRCECCNGEGGQYIDSRDHGFDCNRNNGEGYYVACNMCKGSGEVQPVISVEWKPAGYVKPEFIQQDAGDKAIILTIDDIPSGVR